MKLPVKKESKYTDAKDELLAAKGTVHLIGDFGIGKTNLIKSLDEENVLFDEFIFKNSRYGAIESFRTGESFGRSLKKYAVAHALKKWLAIIIGALISVSPFSFIFSTSLVWWNFIPVILLVAAGISWCASSVYASCLSIFPPDDKYKNLYIENIDRFDWDTIYLLFKWSYKRDKKTHKVVFTYASKNLAERYKEKYGFYPKNLELLLDKFVDQYVDLNIYKDDLAKEIFAEIIEEKRLVGISDSITSITDFNFRIVEKASDFVLENTEIIELLELDKNIVFQINYLSHHNKHAYYWLKNHISDLQSYENSWNEREWFESVDSWEIAMSKKMSKKTKISETPKDLEEAVDLIRIIYGNLHNLTYTDKTNKEDVWENYFINSSVKNASKIIREKNGSELISFYGINKELKSKLLKDWYASQNIYMKHKIFSYIASQRSYSDDDFLKSNFIDLIRLIPTPRKLMIIMELWHWAEKNFKLGLTSNTHSVNNYSTTPYMSRFLAENKGGEHVDESFRVLFMSAIDIYWNEIRTSNIIDYSFSNDWYTYEIIILRKIFNKDYYAAALSQITKTKEIWFAAIVFDDKEEFNQFDNEHWTIPTYSSKNKVKLTEEVLDNFWQKGQEGYKDLEKLLKLEDARKAQFPA